MSANTLSTVILSLISFLTVTLSVPQARDKGAGNRSYVEEGYISPQASNRPVMGIHDGNGLYTISRIRRDDLQAGNKSLTSEADGFKEDDISWSTINEEVDLVIPMVLAHLQKLEIDHMQLPDMKETISFNSLLRNYEAGLFLSNGIVYNLEGIQRHGDAFMTYAAKSFLCRFHLIIRNLQFEYNFLLKLTPIEGYGKIIGTLEDTIVKAELAVDVVNFTLNLNDFRILQFSNIHVQLDQGALIRQLTGLILSPITNLFRDRITTSISDGLKEQMQFFMHDFNNNDPLQLQTFTKQMLGGLTGQLSD